MKKDQKNVAKGIFFILQIGLNMIVSIGLGFLIGYGLSKLTGLDWLVLVGILLGVFAGYRNVYDMVIGYTKGDKTTRKPGPTKEDLFRLEAEKEFSKWKENKDSHEV